MDKQDGQRNILPLKSPLIARHSVQIRPRFPLVLVLVLVFCFEFSISMNHPERNDSVLKIIGTPSSSWHPIEWAQPGVFCVYDSEKALQYVGKDVENCIATIEKLKKLFETATENRNPDSCVYAQVITKTDPDPDYCESLVMLLVREHQKKSGCKPPGNTLEAARFWTIPVSLSADSVSTVVTSDLLVSFEQDSTKSTKEQINDIVCDNPVVLFMKGNDQNPKCKFSKRALNILHDFDIPYKVIDCLDDAANPGLREEIKRYSGWPTIPQLFVNSEFIGGVDIMEALSSYTVFLGDSNISVIC